MRRVVGAVGSVLVVACSGGASREQAKGSIPECDAYAAAYESHLRVLGPDAVRTARERSATLRASSAASANDEAKRAALRARCVEASGSLAAIH
jgi:hypothetical protein